MTVHAPPPSRGETRRLDPRRGTSIAAWATIVAVITALITVRLPQFEQLAMERTADLLVDLDDPELGAASVRVGAITAIVVFILVTIVVTVLVGLLERWLGPAAWAPRPWARVGVGGLTIAIVAIGLQLAAVVQQVPTIGRSPLVLVGIAVIALAAPLAYREGRSRRGYVRGLVVSVVAGVLVWLP